MQQFQKETLQNRHFPAFPLFPFSFVCAMVLKDSFCTFIKGGCPYEIVQPQPLQTSRHLYGSVRSKPGALSGDCQQHLRSGETAEIHAFSNSLEKTVCFVNDLIQKQVQPYQVYNAALRQLSLEVPFLQNGSILGS